MNRFISDLIEWWCVKIWNSNDAGTSLCDVTNVNTSQVQHAEGMSLQDQINADEQRAKIERQIATLERQMNATKQPRRKRELFLELQKLKKL